MKIKNKILRKIISIWYSHPFQVGYEYKKVVVIDHDRFVEYYHEKMLNDGWEQSGDPEAGTLHFFCWYKRKI